MIQLSKLELNAIRKIPDYYIDEETKFQIVNEYEVLFINPKLKPIVYNIKRHECELCSIKFEDGKEYK